MALFFIKLQFFLILEEIIQLKIQKGRNLIQYNQQTDSLAWQTPRAAILQVSKQKVNESDKSQESGTRDHTMQQNKPIDKQEDFRGNKK